MNRSVNKKYIPTVFFVSILFAFFISGCAVPQMKTPMFQPNDNNGHGPNALAWNGRDLIIADNSLIMEINSIETGAFFSRDSAFNSDGFFSFAKSPDSISGNGSKNVRICGMAWEGECCGNGFLWIADGENKEILKLNANNKVIKRIASPAASPRGLAFDGKNLWVADTEAGRLYRFAREDGAVLGEYVSPVKVPSGIAWDNSNLWIVGEGECGREDKNCNKARLVKLDIVSGRVTEEIDLPEQIGKPSALVFIDGTLWISDYELNRIFKVSSEGSAVTLPTVYFSPVTQKRPQGVAVKNLFHGEKEMFDKKPFAAEDPIVRDEAGKSAEIAKNAAEEAKAAAVAAEASARKSEKAFELQQRK